MNCSHVRDNLAALLYGDLPAAEKAELEKHLAGCLDCRREYRSLEAIRQLLGTQPAPEVQINLPELYRLAGQRQERRLRRWRRVALLVSSAAALFAVLALGLRLEARVEPHQLVLRWGSLPPAADVPLPAHPKTWPVPDPPKAAQPVRSSDEQLQLLSKLIHALLDDLQALERREREDTSQLHAGLQASQQQNIQRCADLQHSIDALYLLFHKGE